MIFELILSCIYLNSTNTHVSFFHVNVLGIDWCQRIVVETFITLGKSFRHAKFWSAKFLELAINGQKFLAPAWHFNNSSLKALSKWCQKYFTPLCIMKNHFNDYPRLKSLLESLSATTARSQFHVRKAKPSIQLIRLPTRHCDILTAGLGVLRNRPVALQSYYVLLSKQDAWHLTSQPTFHRLEALKTCLRPWNNLHKVWLISST